MFGSCAAGRFAVWSAVALRAVAATSWMNSTNSVLVVAAAVLVDVRSSLI
jgi:hypothetical protein